MAAFFAMYITTFLAIRVRPLPTPIEHTLGVLFSRINQIAVNFSKLLPVSKLERFMFVLHVQFTKFAMDVRRSKGLEPI